MKNFGCVQAGHARRRPAAASQNFSIANIVVGGEACLFAITEQEFHGTAADPCLAASVKNGVAYDKNSGATK